jgi:hypothetical protein
MCNSDGLCEAPKACTPAGVRRGALGTNLTTRGLDTVLKFVAGCPGEALLKLYPARRGNCQAPSPAPVPAPLPATKR